MKSQRKKATILLVDDDPRIVDVASKLVGSTFELVGCAYDGNAALEAAASLNPDVLVMDIEMPVMNGITVLKELQSLNYGIPVVLLTATDDPDYVSEAFRLGARGYVAKTRMSSDLVCAVQEVLAGGTFVSSTLPDPGSS